MKNHWEKDVTVLTSLCDAQGLLGVTNAFDLFMDMASEHAAQAAFTSASGGALC